MSISVQLSGVTVHRGPTRALESVDLALEPGRVCALIGMNGSGKSTLMATVVGLLTPDVGTVTIQGGTISEARKRGLLAYVPQHEQIDRDFPISVRDVVAAGRYGHLGLSRRLRADDRAAVAHALERVDLADLGDRPIGSLSGGQRKRAFVARAIAQDAPILLLDEPFAGVDSGSAATITHQLRMRAAAGATVLVSTHDLHGLPDLAQEAVLLHRRVLAHGPVAQVLRPELLVSAFGLDPQGTT